MSTEVPHKSLAVVIDPLESLNPKKDSTLVMMEAAARRGWDIYAITLDDLFVDFSVPMARVRKVNIHRGQKPFFEIVSSATEKLETFDVILMRKDPPFNMEYIYAVSMLDLVDPKKTLVSNRPSSLKLFNEKFLINHFPDFMPPSIFTRNRDEMNRFVTDHGSCVAKPMDRMGGQGVFLIQEKDRNRNVILETLSNGFRETIVIQKYIPEIVQGDRRVLVIGGDPAHHALIRRPSASDHRGNLAAGATPDIGEITAYERKVVQAMRPFFLQHGLHLVGLDFIGPYVTEINFTSPTGLVELSEAVQGSLADIYIDYLIQQK